MPLGPKDAYGLFADRLGSWWPAEYSWAGDALVEIGIHPREGAMCFEVGPHGFRCDWGRVLAAQRPERLRFTWQIGPSREPVPDPEQASEVDVRFIGDGAGRGAQAGRRPAEHRSNPSTWIEVEHWRFERHGEGGEGYRDALASDQGWPYMLRRYAAAAAA